ncbi:MAG TPA: PilZ domain-containing protein [Candidatus Omnitrophota bacterium]|nr:PilZ domain-containing protein [Candidatus Omnitrophota bacterium]HPS20823.1 PilZ domain-containing protein [Candidatus Omnitrophota bacterium]
MKPKLPDRRRVIRIEVPLKITVKGGEWIEEVVTKNISPIGLRFETSHKLDADEVLEMQVSLPVSSDPIRIKGRVIWQSKMSLADNAPYDVGVELVDIEESRKNVLLKYLCDLLYGSAYYKSE